MVVLGEVSVKLAGIFRDTPRIFVLSELDVGVSEEENSFGPKESSLFATKLVGVSQSVLSVRGPRIAASPYDGVRNKAEYCPAVDRSHAFIYGIYQSRQK